MNSLGYTDSDTSSNSSIKNTYTYPIWYNTKKHEFYKNLYKRIKLLIVIHSESSIYYSKLEKYIFGPSIFITCLSSIASFLSTSQFIHSKMQSIFGISVGVLASLSSLLQSVGSAYRFSAKQEAHRVASEEYNKLCVKLKFEMEMPNEEKFIDQLEKDIIDIQNKCRYFPPQFITDKYRKLNLEKKKQEKEIESTPLLRKKYCINTDTQDHIITFEDDESSLQENDTSGDCTVVNIKEI